MFWVLKWQMLPQCSGNHYLLEVVLQLLCVYGRAEFNMTTWLTGYCRQILVEPVSWRVRWSAREFTHLLILQYKIEQCSFHNHWSLSRPLGACPRGHSIPSKAEMTHLRSGYPDLWDEWFFPRVYFTVQLIAS